MELSAERPIRFLILDDNRDDRVMTIRALRSEFPGMTVREVFSRAGFEAAMAEGNFDIVITDFKMHWTDGVKIVGEIKRKSPNTAVIMFTATGTQEVAVAAMKAGLDDYVIKAPKHYIRLPVAVRFAADRVQARQKMLDLEARLQSMMDRLSVGVYRASLQGRLLECNPAFLRITGFPSLEEARSVDLNGLLHAGENRPAPDRALAAGQREVSFRRPDGQLIWVLLSEVRTRIDGEAVVDGLLEDISARKRAQNEVRRLNETLEQRVRERTQDLEEFAYSVSHDLREPLRSMEAVARALLEDYDSVLDERGRDYAGRVISAAAWMESLIEDLLAYARLSQLEMPLQTVELSLVVRDASQQLRDTFAERGARIQIADPLPAVVGHYPTLVQAVANLLDNAAKFVVPGQTPEILVQAGATEPGWVRLAVEDNGIGIAPDDRERIFRVFERLHAQEIYPGSGIGLALVKRRVERMGGKVGVQSGNGRGSRFWIELRAPAAESDNE